MSKHHHHPHEGHSAGNPPGSGDKPLRHNWFFYVAGFFLMLALIGFILSNNFHYQPDVRPAPAAPAANGK